MARDRKSLGTVLIMIAASLWAADGVIRRHLYTLHPLVIVFFEHLLGAILLIPVAIYDFPKLKWTQKIIGLTLIVSLFSSLLGTLLFTAALGQVNYISFSVVILLQKLQPLFAIVAAVVILKEKLNKNFVTWALVALVASYFVAFPNGNINFGTNDKGMLMAAAMAIGAALAWGTGTVFSKLLLQQVSPRVATALRFYTTTFLAMIALFLTSSTSLIFEIALQQLFALVLIAVSTGMVALWIYYQGLQTTQAKVATIIELLFPMLAVIIDVFLFDSVLNISQYVAAIVLLMAIWRIGQQNRSDTNMLR